MQELLIAIFNGISIGSVLLIVALGLAIIFGLMGVINLAHGELMMLGAYATFVVQNICNSMGEPIANIYIFFAIPIAFIVGAIAGLILEKGVIRFLYGRPLETLLATWGVSLILRQFVRSVNGVLIIGIIIFCLFYFGSLYFLKKRRYDWEKIKNLGRAIICFLSLAISITCGFLFKNSELIKPWFSSRNVDVTAPVWLQGGLPIGEFQLPYSRIFIIILTAISLLLIYLFLNKSNWGLRIKAVTQNRSMSACLGIPTNQVDTITFSLGSGLAGVAGCAITLLGSVGPNTGQNYIVDAFMVVVVGGVGNLFGTVIAAMGIGITNYLIGSGTIALILGNTESLKPLTDLFNFFATTSMAKVMIFVLIIVFLQLKPAGLFPQKGRGVEL
ncbi:MAG: branched-chain amino acid ABC transporter permease [Okeania sp. SIO2F4]|uniref:ABC transporter permease subunit n=1 Tax=Okeania sp. SIO2F4 TaxID=2607790 RepID=UPI001429D9D2|nr:branched-chain amino acid ABC transporter permease [Okeania sp. SIO2F4]NES06524.1 branched-chain amino acid ABC transporter permease [Okeania sp. SIO2F4]